MKAFHYTESVEFCGKLCHQVMEPEYVTYHGSSHERVACVECHVGSGANWYVKSKLSGLYQVYSVMAKKIPATYPLLLLLIYARLAKPAKNATGLRNFTTTNYGLNTPSSPTRKNTESIIHLQVKTSTKLTPQGLVKGIHQHISPEVKIEYKATDEKRQVIPWVKYTNIKTGEEYVYTDAENMLSEVQLDSLETRVMDCLDCHNRPSHNYNAPQNFIDKSMAEGKISTELPSIKLAAMLALYQDYPDKDSAYYAIETQINEWFEGSYPEVFETKKTEIAQAIAAIKEGYSNNIFPYMKASWKAYPNNIGHIGIGWLLPLPQRSAFDH